MERNQAEEVRAIQDTIYVIGGKWKIPIINSLCNGHRRFKDIQRSIPGITNRMLSKELKELEMNGVIKRVVYDEVPVLVEYQTTPYCKTFADIILAMIEWGKAHKKMVAKLHQPAE